MDPIQNPVPQINPTPPPVPPTPPVFTPPVYSAPPQQHKFNLKKVIAIILIIVILGVGAYVANSAGLFTSPEEHLKKAFLSMDQLTTLHSEIIIDIEYNLPAGTQTGQLVVTADSDVTDKTNPLVDGKIKFSGLGLLAEASMKLIGKTVYFKIDQLPMLAASPIPVLGKWFSISEDDLRKLNETYGKDIPSLQASLDRFKIDTNKYSATEVYEKLEKYQAIESVSSTGFSSNNGSKIRSYDVVINKEAIFNFIIDEQMKLMKDSVEPISQEQIDEMKKIFLEAIDFETFTVDIGVLDGHIHGIKLIANVKNSLGQGENLNKPLGRISFKVDYSDFGKSVSVVAPAESESIFNVVSASLDSARQKGNDAAIKANLSNIRAHAEIFFDKGMSYSGVCTKSEGIVSSLNYIKDKSKSVTTCKATSQAYAVSALLGDGTYWCVDSTGVSKSFSKAPTGTVCK